MSSAKNISILLSAIMLDACAAMPTGPSMLVLPGSGKSFDQFSYDDSLCRLFADGQVGGVTPNQAAFASGLGSAAMGTAVGAAAGAAFGGGHVAAVGAGTGLLAGSMVGAGMAGGSGQAAQQRYNNAYIQCMYAKGNRVPVAGQFINEPQDSRGGQPAGIPPPPPGQPPPPPPRQY